MDKSIIIHLIEGLSKGAKELKLDEFSSIRSLFIPKSSIKENRYLLKDLDIKSCIYFLLNTSEDKKAYIGQTDSINQRLDDHFRNKDWWTDSIVIFYTIDNSLTKSDTLFIEKLLVSKVSQFSEYELLNKIEPNDRIVEKHKLPALREFEKMVYLILGVLGIEIFEELKIKKEENLEINNDFGIREEYKESVEVVCKNKANGLFFSKTNELIVKAGSLVKKPSNHFEELKYYKLFAKLLEDKVIVSKDSENYYFLKDYKFKSPSAASTIILGRSSNGLIDWKLLSTNKTLKEEFEL
jgi:hypothetical protein